MENIKSDRWVYSPTIHFPIQFKFTADETKELENILRSFDKDTRRKFLFFVSGGSYIPLLVVFKTRTFPKDAIEGHLRSLRQCRKTLEKILRGFDPDPQRDMNSIRDPKIAMGESPWAVCCKNAEKALPHIRAIEKTLEGVLSKTKKRRGQPQADQDGFVYEVAKLYKTIFGREPSKAKNGIFSQLINSLFNIVFPKEDGSVHDKSKTVQSAVNKLKAG